MLADNASDASSAARSMRSSMLVTTSAFESSMIVALEGVEKYVLFAPGGV